MKHLSKYIAMLMCMIPLSGAAFAGPGEDQPKTFIVIADLEDSADIFNPAYVKRLASKLTVEAKELDLNYGDTVMLRTANGASFTEELDAWNRTIKLSYQGAKPEDLKGFLNSRMAEIPTLPKSPDSGLLWTLDEVGAETDCTATKAHVIIVSTATHLIKEVNGEMTMQGLPGQPFAGCEKILWLGLAAQGTTDSIEKKNAIESVGTKLGKAMGFKHVHFAR